MTNEVIDAGVLEELKQSAGADFVAELVTAFLEEAPLMIAELRTALETGDSDGFRRTAHSIKSNADIFGAHSLAKPARELELMQASTSSPDVNALVARLDTELARASTVLAAMSRG